MLEVKLLISDLDYDGVVDLVVPAVSQKLGAKGGLVGRIAGKRRSCWLRPTGSWPKRIRISGISLWRTSPRRSAASSWRRSPPWQKKRA